jgi:hypothetical protein
MSNPVNETLAKTLLIKCYTKEHFSNWFVQFIGIKFPDSYIDEHSNSSPLDAAYEAYSAIRDDKCKTVPGYIWLSARDCYKTLSGAALNLIILLHFNISIAHMAAIKDQSEKSLQYFNDFIRKLKPYLEYNDWEVTGEAKDRIQLLNKDKQLLYIRVIVANKAGGNSEHVPCMSFDELEVLSSEGVHGYKEAKNIPTRRNFDDGTGVGPLIIKYSTRKYAGGIFGREIDNAKVSGEIVRQWNLIDVTEKCKPDRYLPDLPKVNRYIGNNLPLSNISEERFNELPDKEKEKYSLIRAHAGCATCPLLPVCKTKLADRPENAKGGLYKDIDFVIGRFKINDPDTAEAQLLCWKPSTQGMVYPRFSNNPDGTGNVFTVAQAYEFYTSEKCPLNFSHDDLVRLLISKGIRFHCGVDWGFEHAYSIIVTAKVSGQWWILESVAITGLEWEQMVAEAERIRDKYNRPAKWYADTSEPRSIKGFNKRKMPCADFKKDVNGGIEAVRGQIIDASGVRRLKVIESEHTQVVLHMFKNHTFKLDTLGNPTREPDDTIGVADSADALRYAGQNMFEPKGKNELAGQKEAPLTEEQIREKYNKEVSASYTNWLSKEIKSHTSETKSTGTVVSKSGSIVWDID